MSKKCPECGCDELCLTTEKADIFDFNYLCNNCGHIFEREVEPLPLYTVFEHITQSVEVLAEKMVYVSLAEYYKPFSANKCGNGIVLREEWRSTITGGTWKTRAEAIAATVEELKKEYKK